MSNRTRLTLTQPDDWHLHLRSGAMLKTAALTLRHFGRAIIMPNLQPPVVRTADAVAYRTEIESHLPEHSNFEPLMTLYLTEQTDPDDVRIGHESGCGYVKLCPAGATTNWPPAYGIWKGLSSAGNDGTHRLAAAGAW
ncbi:MAG: hypothetical protein R3E95_17980 [Thiolinea sp.]